MTAGAGASRRVHPNRARFILTTLALATLGCVAEREGADGEQEGNASVTLEVVRSHPQPSTAEPAALHSIRVPAGGSATLLLGLDANQYAELFVRTKTVPPSAGASGPQLIGRQEGSESRGDESASRMLLWKGGVGRPLCWVGASGPTPQLQVEPTRPVEQPYVIEAVWTDSRPAVPEDRDRCRVLLDLAEAEAVLHHDRDRRSLELLDAVVATATELGDPEALAYAWLEVAHARGAFSTPHQSALAARAAAEQFAVAGREAERLDALNHAANAKLKSKEAIVTLKEVLEGQRALGNGYGEAVALNTLALAYMHQHDPSKAFSHFLAAYDRAAEIGDVRQQSLALHNVAEMFLRLGDFTRTIEFSQRALPMHHQLNDIGPAAHAYEHLFDAYMARGEEAKAREMIDRAVSLSRQIESTFAEARAHQKLAGLLVAEGEFEQALDLYQGALEVFKQFEIADKRALTLAGMASLHTERGDFGRARSLHREAMQIQGSSSLSAIPSLTGLARIHHLEGDVEGALSFGERAVALVEASRSRVADEDLRAHYFATQRHLYDLIVELHLERGTEESLQRAFAVVERAKARSWVDVLNRTGIYSTLPLDLEERASNNRRALSQQLGESLQGATGVEPREPRNRRAIEELRTEWDLLRQEMRARGARAATVSFAAPATVDQVQQRLRSMPKKSAFIEFHVAERATQVFVITTVDAVQYEALGAAVLGASVEELRRLISAPRRRSWNRYAKTAHQLFDELLGPELASLKGVEEIVVAADGPLLGLPMGALLTEVAAPNQTARDLRYAAFEWSFRQVPSATAWLLRSENLANASSLDQPGAALIVASSNTAATTSPLPHAETEAGTVAALYRQPHLWTGGESTESRFKNAAATREARVLHFAVHADANERRPAESALLMSRQATPATASTGTEERALRDDGRLTAEELSGMSLAADLVVLSACGSGLGENVSGEGYLGLTRSFQLAGARQVLASLWRVADESTAQLMIVFHRQLREHGDPARALKEAQAALIDSSFAHPYYWAAFVLNG